MREIDYSVERLVPNFILHDKNGYALAKAIETCMRIVAEAAEKALAIISDPEQMPEWRLDEVAEDLGILYDFNASLESKRYWVSNATALYSVYGTPQAIYNFLEGTFTNVDVEEAWQYDGDPLHFQVDVSGQSYDSARIAWAQKAIAEVKRAACVLDSVTIDTSTEIVVTTDSDWFTDYARTDEAITDEGVTG